jgi:hypothetical protein
MEYKQEVIYAFTHWELVQGMGRRVSRRPRSARWVAEVLP